jgi:tRNA(adenine34) deaminase
MTVDNDEFFMREALKEAQAALKEDEVPVGCVAVFKNQVIGRGHNRTESLRDPTAHAEIICITAACNALSAWRLKDVEVYCTIEPCAMCAGALVLARVKRVIFGGRDEKFGGCGSVFNVVREQKLNHRVEVTEGVMKNETVSMLQLFFEKKRQKEKKE